MATKPKGLPLANATGAALHCPGVGVIADSPVFITEALAGTQSVRELVEGGSLELGAETTADGPVFDVPTTDQPEG